MSATIQSAGCPAPAQDNKLLLWQRFIKGRGISYIVLAVIGIVWIFPFLWMALGSLKTQREILAKPPKLMPEHATLANFSQWFTQLNFGSYFTNSLIVAVITVLGNMVFCSMVGYALAKMKFAGKNILFGAVMVTLMVPSVATFVPLFVIISNMHLANTYATLSILTFLSSWNNFLWPLVSAQSEEMYTLPVALSLYSTGQNATNYSVLLAGAVLIITPILLLFVFLQRYFIQGVAMTGIK